ncbi:MAG: hypothetical protein N4A35_01240, partial [Flavobacteriales bacterium]|nr:hypothetical protein [Flavobacteriales bacterium]
MKKKYYLSIPLFLILLLFTLNHNAQGLNEITGMRIYEHHSAIINGGNGGSANGTQSGYDFVNHTYYNSFDPNSFGPYTMGEEMNIDLVEHNGPYSSNASTSFGFTSGVSSIWAGDITGNGITLWVKAPTSFNYGMLNNASVMESTYNSGTPSISVESVSENDVYIGRIRNTNDYVAMRCYNVTATTEDVYFDFDYKYDGGCNTTGVDIQLACGSFTWIDGNTYTNSNNTATHTLTSSQGCDSVVTLNLTINSTINTTDTQVACGSYTWTDGNTYTASNNTATQTLTSIQGCDSVVTLNLTINSTINTTDTQVACGSYTWTDGKTKT